MGEIAESLLDGEFDCISGEYLGEGVGYPRSMHDKYNNPNGPEYGNNPTKGITNYLMRFSLTRNQKRAIVRKYCGECLSLNFELIGFDKCCVEIQKDFGKFIKFIKSEINNQK